MSENSKSTARKQTIISYDHKKVIKGIDLSTIYITSLQNIITKKISENPDTMLTIGQTFKDFEHIQTEAKKKDEDSSYEVQDMPTLTEWEADLYCLYSLLQTFKWHANKQGFKIETEIDVEEGVFKKTVEKLKEGVDIKEDMLKLQAMLEKSQQSS
jgi:hypothetical protein